MNVWNVSAVLLKDAVVVDSYGVLNINFSAVNSELLTDKSGIIADSRKTFIDVFWPKGDVNELEKLKKDWEVELFGKPYIRRFTRNDGSRGEMLGMIVTSVKPLRKLVRRGGEKDESHPEPDEQ